MRAASDDPHHSGTDQPSEEESRKRRQSFLPPLVRLCGRGAQVIATPFAYPRTIVVVVSPGPRSSKLDRYPIGTSPRLCPVGPVEDAGLKHSPTLSQRLFGRIRRSPLSEHELATGPAVRLERPVAVDHRRVGRRPDDRHGDEAAGLRRAAIGGPTRSGEGVKNAESSPGCNSGGMIWRPGDELLMADVSGCHGRCANVSVFVIVSYVVSPQGAPDILARPCVRLSPVWSGGRARTLERVRILRLWFVLRRVHDSRRAGYVSASGRRRARGRPRRVVESI